MVSTALKAQMEQGTFRKRNLPYGYRWDEARSNMVIDEEVAQYVRLSLIHIYGRNHGA